MHDKAKPLTRVLVAMILKNLYYGQGVAQQAGQNGEGNLCCGLQGQLEEDSPKQRRGLVEVHMALLVDNWCYRAPGVEARSNLDFRRVHERLQRVLRLRSNKSHQIDCEAKTNIITSVER